MNYVTVVLSQFSKAIEDLDDKKRLECREHKDLTLVIYNIKYLLSL